MNDKPTKENVMLILISDAFDPGLEAKLPSSAK